jgi:hypothetical protein
MYTDYYKIDEVLQSFVVCFTLPPLEAGKTTTSYSDNPNNRPYQERQNESNQLDL